MSLEVVNGKRERCDGDPNKILGKSQRLAKKGEDGGGCMFVGHTQYTEVGVDPLADTQRSSSSLPESGPGPDFAWSAESTGTGAAAYANPDSEPTRSCGDIAPPNTAQSQSQSQSQILFLSQGAEREREEREEREGTETFEAAMAAAAVDADEEMEEATQPQDEQEQEPTRGQGNGDEEKLEVLRSAPIPVPVDEPYGKSKGKTKSKSKSKTILSSPSAP